MMMSVVAATLSTVGIRNSDFGRLELMWYPLATRNDRGTVAGLPCITVTTGAGAIFTAAACGPRSSCAQAHSGIRRSALARRIFISPEYSRFKYGSRLLLSLYRLTLAHGLFDVVDEDAAALQAEFAGDELAVAI